MDAVGDARSVADVLNIIKQEGKFVSAQTRDNIFRAHAQLKLARDRYKQLIGDDVPEAVVEELEAIKIEEEDSEQIILMPFGARDGVLQVVNEQSAVRQARESVVQRGMRHAVLGHPALGDVLKGEQNQLRAGGLLAESAGIEQHYLPANDRELVINLVILEEAVMGQDFLQQRS